MIPLVIACYGKQGHLPTILHHAERYGIHTIVIGDELTRTLGSEHFLLSDYNDGEFVKVYEPMCRGGHKFHLFCFERWFAIRNFARNYGKVFVSDADVMVYCDLEQQGERLGDCLAAYLIPESQPGHRWAAAGSASYWTPDGLDSFCDFMLSTYTSEEGLAALRKKWQWHRDTGWHGGVCDMTLFYLFSREYNVKNICHVEDGSTFDLNINTAENAYPDEYEMAGHIKRIKWVDNKPYGYNLILDNWVRFNSLHFQGSAKRLIGEFDR